MWKDICILVFALQGQCKGSLSLPSPYRKLDGRKGMRFDTRFPLQRRGVELCSKQCKGSLSACVLGDVHLYSPLSTPVHPFPSLSFPTRKR